MEFKNYGVLSDDMFGVDVINWSNSAEFTVTYTCVLSNPPTSPGHQPGGWNIGTERVLTGTYHVAETNRESQIHIECPADHPDFLRSRIIGRNDETGETILTTSGTNPETTMDVVPNATGVDIFVHNPTELGPYTIEGSLWCGFGK
ncbi:hypothetical protein ACH4ZX_08740 [Streptomyces sp. NPDC020490]|uniref:hypothetical protein n=1 Tax=Streptomyces sp. NPDC020490 TaxID=3365078 RepID=UPI00378F1AEF